MKIVNQAKKEVSIRYTPEFTAKFYFKKLKNGKPRYTLMEKKRMLKVFRTLQPNIEDIEVHEMVSDAINELLKDN